LAASEGLILTAQAIKTAGLITPQRTETSKKRVCRKAQKIKLVGHDDGTTTFVSSVTASTPRQLVMEPNPTSHNSVSSLSAPLSNSPSTLTNQGPVTTEQEELRRQLVGEASLIDSTPRPRKHCRSSKQKHIEEFKKTRREKCNQQQ